MRIAVVGAGLAGLTAARELQRAGAQVLVLEQEQRPGGVILTERPEGGRWVVEGGPDSWLASDPDLGTLAGEVGVADRVIGQQARGALLWDGRALSPLGEGEAATLLGFEVKTSDVRGGGSSPSARGWPTSSKRWRRPCGPARCTGPV